MRVLAIVVALVVMASAIALFVLSRNLNEQLYEDVHGTLREIQTLDGRWRQEVLRVSTDAQADFDGLAAFIPLMREHKIALKTLIAGPVEMEGDDKNAIRAFLSMLDGREERIERFKSGYAIVRNSQRYLPAAASEAAARTRADAEAGIAMQVESRLVDLERYLDTPSEVEKQRLLLALDGLRERSVALQSEAGGSLGTFIAHATVLLEQKEPMDGLLAQATDNATNDEAEALQARFNGLREHAVTLRNRYDFIIMGLVGVLFVLVLAVLLTRPRQPAPPQPAEPSLALEPELNVAEAAPAPPQIASAEQPPAPEPASPDDGFSARDAAAKMERVNASILIEDIAQSAATLRSHVRLLREVHLEMSQGLTQTGTALDETVGEGTAVDGPLESKLIEARDKLSEIQQIDSIPKLVQSMQRASERIHYAAKQYARGAYFDEPRTEDWININECLDVALELTGLEKTATVRRENSELPPILGAREELVTMFVNLLANAVEAQGADPVIRVKSEVEGDSIAVTIMDNGVGMDNATRKSAFNMFYSTKKGARGIGLSTVRLLANRHNGQVLLNSVTDKGTAVRVLLPMSGAPAQPA